MMNKLQYSIELNRVKVFYKISIIILIWTFAQCKRYK